ncbi:MAG: DUF5312 domain-containing protein [Bacteroides sp.]|nr:DUF5312 domain-containing protein [Prevotella sp.]MCM1407710.1 DUF5312 domain-containing protein [Treponema brennaborense]MCM1469140.1 DUF5312 domain-containing protein [Bacteroides sp.]
MSLSNSFDRLVSEISQDERLQLLKKLESVPLDPASQNLAGLSDADDSEIKNLSERLKTEPFLLRIILRIKSLFSSDNIETLYNNYLIASCAQKIEKKYPDTIDYKHGFILSSVYAKLQELKQAAAFFKPGIAVYEEKQGQFLVFLGSLIIPEITVEMEKNVSPYTLPLDREVTGELRASFLRKMEEILQAILIQDKNRLYAAVQGLEWLKHFVHLPFDRFLSRFFAITGTINTCPLDAANGELAAFAKVLCNGTHLPTEIFEALYLFSLQAQHENQDNPQDASERIKEEAAVYLKKSMEQVAAVKSFIASVPLKQLAGIAAHSSVWQAEKLEGAEDWFVKYKNHWRKLFDQKWESWLKDKRQEQTRQNVVKILGTKEYPSLPSRPWTTVWGGIPFSHELTAGFLNAFFEIKYPVFNKLLKIIMVEGEFLQHETQVEFTDAYNEFYHLSLNMQNFNEKLSDKGIWGTSFTTVINESLRTIQGQTKIDSLMRSIEAESAFLAAQFRANVQTVQTIISGILTENRNARKDLIGNISTIQGKSNTKFKEDLHAMKACLAESLDILKELEDIEISLQKKQ